MALAPGHELWYDHDCDSFVVLTRRPLGEGDNHPGASWLALGGETSQTLTCPDRSFLERLVLPGEKVHTGATRQSAGRERRRSTAGAQKAVFFL